MTISFVLIPHKRWLELEDQTAKNDTFGWCAENIGPMSDMKWWFAGTVDSKGNQIRWNDQGTESFTAFGFESEEDAAWFKMVWL